MKRIQYKIVVLLVFISTSLIAQNHRRTYNEEFSTNKDVVIDVNTRNTDVKIETWNKNKVSIEAIIEVEGAEDDRAESTLDDWKFNATGNKSQVEITSRSSGVSSSFFSTNGVNRIIVNGNDYNEFDYEFDFPEVKFDNLIALNNDIMVLPEIPELPNMDNINFDFHFEHALPKFDYEKYKKDKSYLKKWQKEMEENLEKNKIKWENDAENAKEHAAVLKVELQEMAEQQKKHAEQRKKIMEKQLAQHKEHAKQREKKIILRKKELAKRKVEVDKKRNLIIDVLADREKIKVKRTIIIRAPKDAKFKMNVKYGTLSFPN